MAKRVATVEVVPELKTEDGYVKCEQQMATHFAIYETLNNGRVRRVQSFEDDFMKAHIACERRALALGLRIGRHY